MIITFEGRDWPVDIDEIEIDEWRQLKAKYGMTPKAFQDNINEADPDASTFLYWVMLRRSGQAGIPLGNHLRPDIIELNAAMARAVAAEQEEEQARQKAEMEAAAAEAAAAVPTRPGGPPSPEPRSRTGTTRAPRVQPVPAEAASSRGSGAGTSAPSGTSTSSSSPGSADLTPAPSEV